MKFETPRFETGKLKGKQGKIRDFLLKFRLPAKFLFILTGVIATIWFLVRVIPKPSRAAYPCMKAASPFMSGLILFIMATYGAKYVSLTSRYRFLNLKYVASFLLVIAGVVILSAAPSRPVERSLQAEPQKTGPVDGPNQPVGTGTGIFPGRVIWAWDPKATNENCRNAYDFYKPENTNQGVVNRMVVDAVKKLTGKASLHDAWDALFRSFNTTKGKPDRGYTPGEKIFIKINQGTANGKLRNVASDNGFMIPVSMSESEDAKRGYSGSCETIPDVVLELLRELVHVMGIDQKDISIGDPISHIFSYNYEAWSTEFPDIRYLDKTTEKSGRTLVTPTTNDLVFYSDKKQSDKLYDFVENADYMINVANLKPHGRAGISLTAKNHFGTQGRQSAFHLHYSLISPVSLGNPTNNGYGKYRVMVDLMGSRYLGRNTVLFIIDGLYGGGSNETRVPVKYFMPPFNNDWCNSVFMSQDQVALESVCYDFLRSEWNGAYSHSPANNAYETIPNVFGVDDYLHQAADRSAWPAGIVYDPDNSGKPIPCLGVHEHWNNMTEKQYSRNLGKNEGIELVSIPGILTGHGNQVPVQEVTERTLLQKPASEAENITSTENKEGKPKDTFSVRFVSSSFTEGFTPRNFRSVTIDHDNVKWFVSESGIVSYDGSNWTLHNKNRKVPAAGMKNLAFDSSPFGEELWIASPKGATVASLPVDAVTGATTYYPENSPIGSENVISLTVGRDAMRWFGTDKGIAGFRNRKWLKPAYQRKYPESTFSDYPITAMATSPDGDSLYAATLGAGVTRVFRDKVDAITGASEYAQWGPIEIPSDNVYSICILPDGTQWFGTDKGAARHSGYRTLENWTVFNTGNGLVDNLVQAIADDSKGNIWFGTKAGISVYDGNIWHSLTEKDSLISNNILCIKADNQGVVWFGTDKGIMSYHNGTFTCFR